MCVNVHDVLLSIKQVVKDYIQYNPHFMHMHTHTCIGKEKWLKYYKK